LQVGAARLLRALRVRAVDGAVASVVDSVTAVLGPNSDTVDIFAVALTIAVVVDVVIAVDFDASIRSTHAPHPASDLVAIGVVAVGAVVSVVIHIVCTIGFDPSIGSTQTTATAGDLIAIGVVAVGAIVTIVVDVV
jgi:hypothetical protein